MGTPLEAEVRTSFLLIAFSIYLILFGKMPGEHNNRVLLRLISGVNGEATLRPSRRPIQLLTVCVIPQDQNQSRF